jgi:hypothetical protein
MTGIAATFISPPHAINLPAGLTFLAAEQPATVLIGS